MKVLVAHVRYRARGGEDKVFDDEVALLRAAGVEVSVLDIPSLSLRRLGAGTALQVALSGGDHAYGRGLMRDAIAARLPEVVHFHNIYPLLGTGAMHEARDAGCGVVRTYHNYRLSCIAGTHFFGDAQCERCAPGRRSPGVARGCYRGSRLQSAAMAAACEREWCSFIEDGVPDTAICPTTFARQKLKGYGAPESRIVLKPNSIEATEISGPGERDGAMFVGRLGQEKGVVGLVEAWERDLPRLTVVGDGPLLSRLAKRGSPNVSLMGEVPWDEVRRLMCRTQVVLVPSLAYEAGSLVIAEAFAVGTPVVCFDHGSLSEVGQALGAQCIVPTGDFRTLVRVAAAVLEMPPLDWTVLSARARAAYERNYRPEASLATLLEVYSGLDARAKSRR